MLLAAGGYGSDIIALTLDTVGLGGPDDGDGNGAGGGPVVIYGGINSTLEGVDGADRVFVAGSYDEVVAGLGFDDDIYVGSADAGAGLLRDLVSGDDGNDVIST